MSSEDSILFGLAPKILFHGEGCPKYLSGHIIVKYVAQLLVELTNYEKGSRQEKKEGIWLEALLAGVGVQSQTPRLFHKLRCPFVCLCHRPGPGTAWTRDFWLKSISL